MNSFIKSGVVQKISIDQEFDFVYFEDGSVERVPAEFKAGFFEGALINVIKDHSGQILDIKLENEVTKKLGLVA